MNSFSQAVNPYLVLASFFEGNFSLDWIIELTGDKPSKVLAGIDEGIQLAWIDKLQDGFFAFKEAKVKKEIQESMGLPEKQLLHRRIAEFLLRELPDNINSSETISRHFLQIPNNLEDCRYLLKYADTARQKGLFGRAMSCYKKVLSDISNMEGTTADSLFVETTLKYARFAVARENSDEVISIIRKSILRAERNKMNKELFLLKMQLAKNEFLRSNYLSAQRCFDEGWAVINDIDAYPRFMLSALAFRIFSYFWQGHFKEGIREYEDSTDVIEQFPIGENPILSTSTVGICYAYTGQVAQGLGKLHALRKHCVETGNLFLAGDVDVTISVIMLELRRPDEAIAYLKNYRDDHLENDWNVIRAKIALALAYYLNGKEQEAIACFENWLDRVKKVNVHGMLNPAWFELCKAMEEGNFPRLGGIRLEDEIKRFEACENLLMKGGAYRYKALLQERDNQSSEQVINSLTLSAKCLRESGHVFELCRTYLELIRLHTLNGDSQSAHKLNSEVSEIFSALNQEFIPNDLQCFVKKTPRDWDSFCDALMKLNQDISAAIQNKKKLLQVILSTANRFTGSERGVLFKVNSSQGNLSRIQLVASKNITAGEINQESFEPVLRIVEEVAVARTGRITQSSGSSLPVAAGSERILSQIFVPMIMRNKVVGVLYHDNTHFTNSFEEPDLKLLSGLASHAAIALDNAEAYAEIQRLNQKLSQEKQYYKEQSVQNNGFEDIIGVSPGITEVLIKINQVANTDTTVLILGETGVGKDLVARAIHKHSKRVKQPFIKVLCNALPESLISSELFGHEKGAFTGSIQRRIGRFELADGGTIFLDEIGDLQIDIQTQLLQVLQSKEFERVGGSETIRSDFRLITATNIDLAEAVKNKKFRSDLYYRLNVFPIYVPPLRDRKEDIPILAYHFLKIYSVKLKKLFDGIPKREMEKLTNYNWPGNIRELEGIIERAVVLNQNNKFMVPELSIGQTDLAISKTDLTLEENERLHILKTLKRTGWKVRGKGGAAELLNLNSSTLFFRMKKLGIKRPSSSKKEFLQ